MNRIRGFALVAALAGAFGARAVEVTVSNDSLANLGTATIVTGFVPGEAAASWLTSPCDGNVRAAQVYWRSLSGGAGIVIHSAVNIHRGGTFPQPGAIAQSILGPVLNDNVVNEWRFVDENNTIPVNVPVTEDEVFVVSFVFAEVPPPSVGPSVTRDNNGILPSRNSLLANIGGNFFWLDAALIPIAGDWVIRAVVDCPTVAPNADVSVAMNATPTHYTAGAPLQYTLSVSNAGPGAAAGTTVVDVFPATYTGVTWTCSGSGGATCVASGSGHLSQLVNLPSGGSVEFDISGTVAAGTTGTLGNSATAVVAVGVTDPVAANNTITLDLTPPPQADVGVGLTADPATYIAGAALGYTLVVNNGGPAAAPGTTVVDIFPAALGGVTWTCSGANGATCPASGNGNLTLQVDLPSGGEVVFDVSGTVVAGTTATLSNSITAVVSAAVADPVPGNNTASIDTLAGVLGPGIFADGFEE